MMLFGQVVLLDLAESLDIAGCLTQQAFCLSVLTIFIELGTSNEYIFLPVISSFFSQLLYVISKY